MSAPAPVPDPTAIISAPAPSVAVHESAVATAAAVAANASPGTVPGTPGTSPKEVTGASGSAVTVPAATKSNKSKKKKSSQATVTMATAPSSQEPGHGAAGENTGRWTAEEHRLFLQGLEQHGKGWKKIASLIKSRTVVQIRTHAQKYFQKLAKARQNGEEGEISMEGRGGPASVPSGTGSTSQSHKRRRQTSGTKRKAIQSVVASAQRQGKKIAASQDAWDSGKSAPLPAVAPALRPYVLPAQPPHGETVDTQPCIPSVTSAQGSISGPALEDSLFRFLTPAPVAPAEPQVNEVARQAGANPITVPTENHGHPTSGGDVSPTGVAEFALYPSWTDAKDTPSWYAKGSDVDALLDVADTLDWLTDTGDLNEAFPPSEESLELAPEVPGPSSDRTSALSHAPSVNNMSVNTLPRVSSGAGMVVPPLPSLFDGATESEEPGQKLSSHQLVPSTSTNTIDDHLQVFDSHLEEHDFVSSMLDDPGESSENLVDLQ